MDNDEIKRVLTERPAAVDPERWSDMDPKIRTRFHEFANYMMRLEGVITALLMRVPEKPETLPLLEQRVETLQKGADRTERKVDKLDEKFDQKFEELQKSLTALAIRVAVISAVIGAAVAGGTKIAGLS